MTTNLIKRRGDKWTFVADVPRENGQRRQVRRSFRTQAEARRALADLLSDANKGTVPARRRGEHKITFESFATEWFEARKRQVRSVTANGYRAMINNAVRAFGQVPIGDVTRTDVEKLINAKADAGRSARTAALLLFVLRSIFERAVDDGLIFRNPAKHVEPVGRDAKARQAFDTRELATMRAHLASDRLFGCWLLSLYGMRRSEVLGIRWSDVDLTTGELDITRGRVLVDGQHTEEGKPKTQRGTRTLHLPSDVLAALRAMRTAQLADFGGEQVRSGYLAVDETGAPYRHERFSDEWQRHCASAGVRVVPLHSARHSSVTAMRNARIPDHVIAAWHGHDESIMRRVYSHADSEGLANAGQVLSAVFGDRHKLII